MSKATQTARTRNNGARPQSEIARLAEEIARLRRLQAEISAKQANYEENEGDLPDGRDAPCFFGDMNKHARDRIKVLEGSVSLLEPETLDDVLTLMLLLGNALEFFIEDCISQGMCSTDSRFKEAERKLDRLRQAIVRGLMKFASSPLVRRHYWCLRYEGKLWDDELAFAETELAKLPVKCDQALDPADRTTHH